MKLLPNRMLGVLSHEEFVEVRRILLSLGYKWRKAGNYQNCIVSPSGKPVTDRDHSEYYMEPECLELVRSVGNAEDVLRQYQLPEPRPDLVSVVAGTDCGTGSNVSPGSDGVAEQCGGGQAVDLHLDRQWPSCWRHDHMRVR
jgi:hypothetical protein